MGYRGVTYRLFRFVVHLHVYDSVEVYTDTGKSHALQFIYTTIAALSAKMCTKNRTDFYPLESIRHQKSRKFFYPYILQVPTFGPLAFCVCPLFFTTTNQKEFRIATVAIFRCDLYAAAFPQMSPPPPTKNCARHHTTTQN